MSILELALAIALGIAIVTIAPILVIGVLWGIFAIPCAVIEYYQDKKMEKELIAKGARNFKVKNGKIYIDDKEEG